MIQQGDRMFIFQAWPPAAVEIKASGSIGNHREASTAHARGVYSHRLHRETRCGAKRCVVRLLQYRGWRLEELRVRNVRAVLGYRARGWWELFTQSIPILDTE